MWTVPKERMKRSKAHNVSLSRQARAGTDLHMYGTLWLLTQGESRKTKRVRLFTDFMSRRLAAHAPLLAGLSISRD